MMAPSVFIALITYDDVALPPIGLEDIVLRYNTAPLSL